MANRTQQRPKMISTTVPIKVREVLERYAKFRVWSLSQATARSIVVGIKSLEAEMNEK